MNLLKHICVESSRTSKESPHTNVESPHTNVESPHTNVESPHTNVESPHTNVESPHTNVESSTIGIFCTRAYFIRTRIPSFGLMTDNSFYYIKHGVHSRQHIIICACVITQ